MTRRAAHSSACPLDTHDEASRLAVLQSLELLDTPPEREFDAIVQCAKSALDCQIALVSIVDDHRQWFKAKCGLDAAQTPREQAFCAHVVAAEALLVVPDATADPRFAANPLVTGAPHIRFYAGVPIYADGGEMHPGAHPLGTLCVIDDKPRNLSAVDEKILRDLASLVESLIVARNTAANAIRLSEERRAMLQQLDLNHRQFKQAERMANIGSWRLDLLEENLEWSDQVYAIHELARSAIPPLVKALEYYPPQARAAVSAALTRTIQTGESMDEESDFITARGALRRVRTMGELEMRDGQAVAVIGVFQDITSRHALEQALRETAHVDDLTKIANRAHFNQVADQEISAARQRDESLALILIDLDHFKTVNDRCGHMAGDDLLRLMAAKLRAPYLAECFAARLGGDEFVLLVPARKAGGNLTRLIGRLLGDLRHPVRHDDGIIPVSGTIGASWLDDTVRDRSELLHRADVALYEAKRISRGTATIFGQAGLITPDDGKSTPALRAVY
ncbi:sensor domain-containing diguanylate cyclase [Sphingobium phenoxybenzoativorans]|uniref:Sensor domain-containing diguanylate cyclase n=1 Tax=Sphingobium phenoxybenzoativorans TaxID=1592790 RepID=A0A975K4C1_9SPHN|nr:sensor domain-containing diguanylate cyclase [Sphingobium phenoxybenzoativorans]QUT04595.1 sensor domain-containing diguanylate cyclase [Sphingobium phenoxybenzoativorans]